MIAPTFTGRQWVEDGDQESASQPTAHADVSLALHEQQKRQLGFALTLGDAVFSIGLGPNGLPAFTVDLGQPASPTPLPPVPTPTPRPAPIPTSPAPAPTTAATTRPPQTAGTAPVPVPLPSSADESLPATSNPLIDTESTGLPTIPIQSPRSSSSRATTTRGSGGQTVTQLIFAGGSTVTSVGVSPTSTGDSSGALSPPAIAGAVVGAVGGTAALLLLLVLCMRWRKHRKSRKRISAGTESVKALHTGPAPMMAHNSARYTEMFPAGGGVVISDADSGRMTFLPAGAAGFLNRASGSPLQGPSRTGSPVNGMNHLSIPPTPTVPAQYRSGPPSPSVPAHYQSGSTADVAFLAAGASEWLNRNPNNPMSPPGPSAGPMAGPSSGPSSSPDGGAMIAAAAVPTNASNRSLPSQAAPGSDGGNVAFMPAAASAFLNQQPGSPMQSDGNSSNKSPPPIVAAGAVSNDSSRSLPSQNAPQPQNANVAFLPGDASAYLNRGPSSPLQSVTTSSEQPSFPPPAPSSSAGSSVPYHTPAPEPGRVTFLPADASGFLNRTSTGPLQPGQPYISTPPPVPASYNAGAPTAAALAVPAASSAAQRDSAATNTNQKLNDNPEWFGSDYHDSRQIAPAAVSAAARRSSNYGAGNDEIDQYLNGGSSHPPQDSYGPVARQNPFESPADHSHDQHSTQQHPGSIDVPPVPGQIPQPQHTPPPVTMPEGAYRGNNAPWVPPQSRRMTQKGLWPAGAEDDSWYQPPTPEPRTPSQFMSWPKPPEVDWNRARVKPRGAI